MSDTDKKRASILKMARDMSAAGMHRTAACLFAQCGISYVTVSK